MKASPSLKWEVTGFEQIPIQVSRQRHSLFKTLKKCARRETSVTNTEAEEAFTQLQQHIASTPTLIGTPYKRRYALRSKALQDTEINYSAMEEADPAQYLPPKELRRGSDIGGIFSIEKPEPILSSPERSQLPNHDLISGWIFMFGQGRAQPYPYHPKGWNSLPLRFESQPRQRRPNTKPYLSGLRIAARMVTNLELMWNSPFSSQPCVERERWKGEEEEEKKLFMGRWDGGREKGEREHVSRDCQVHRPIPRQPQQELAPITSPWPFHKWGIDIAGPFPAAAGGLKFLIVAIDYFTKWIEAKAVATITGNQVKRFVWDNIVCRFGLPGEIVSDNGKQFCDNPFKDWCSRLSITQRFASVKHPQTNGLVERANRSLGEGIKARLDRHKGRWVEELSHVLWAHRTTIKVSTGDTPFSLVYGTEAVIPAEIGMPTIRTAEVNITTNDDERRIDLDILEERREQAAIREEKAKLKMKGYYDAKVRGVSFRPGDFVYRANDASHAEDTGKLGPKWEGPYEVTEALGKGAYKLRDMDGRELPRTWNICNLKKCYL
ncbi:reverse transcriptase domain-containing protein [Tanacetum coccineum]